MTLKATAARVSMTEKAAARLTALLSRGRELDRLEVLKMKLGIEMLLINLSKTTLIYAASAACHLLWQTLVLHTAYYAVRRSSFGLHANTSLGCTLSSAVLLLGLPYLAIRLPFGNFPVLLTSLICLWILARHAPADTSKFPLLGPNRRRKLRSQSLGACLAVTAAALLCPAPFKALLMLGAALQTLMIHPFTYQLLKRSVNNYEQYEAGSVSRN
ncbi:accessory regulator AgrB [Paenibacillus spiritus]|uniref:Accessory regulator AgrB n=1 Tax=Paenibacillus spiritus TaxID=2496557 RepID=A0A5J5FYH8_9BACL|nr:accessory gene regulator B family protein [Paenibacillus spiritus]KAA8998808.1 accessory regulator AgrB [Paenibacillus spiritus]